MAIQFALNNVRFEDVRSSIIEYLQSENEYAGQFDFAASNFSYFIDVASYITMILSYQNTLEANEIFLDTTSIRRNAINIAKAMGYRPKRKKSSRFTGTLEYVSDNSDAVFTTNDTITIPARTLFTSSSGYTYQNLEPITLKYETDNMLSAVFTVYEGIFVSFEVLGTGKPNQTIIIDDENVEEDNLSVFIRKSNLPSTENIEWLQTKSFFTEDEETIYFVQENTLKEKTVKILFGDGIVGQVPKNTETITVEYLQTNGSNYNGETSLAFLGEPTVSETLSNDFVYSFTNMTINIPSGQVSYGGSDNETLEDIKLNAPKFYSSGGRIVNEKDLNIALKEFSSQIDYHNAEAGISLRPNQDNELGKIYITVVPTGIDENDFLNNGKIYLYESEEESILRKLKNRLIGGLKAIFQKATYLYINANPILETNKKITTQEINSILNAAQTNLQTYYDDNKNLGNNFRSQQYLSILNKTNGVVSGNITFDIYFILNQDVFYTNKESRSYLPTLYQRNENGDVIYDENLNPSRKNFVKLRSDIIIEENEKRLNTDLYTQANLPISLSPIYGKLTQSNSTRYIYNTDITNLEIVKFTNIGTSTNPILDWESYLFEDEAGNIYSTNIVEISTNNWAIQLNGRSIGNIYRNSAYDTYELTNIESSYLTTLGFNVNPIINNKVFIIQTVATSESDSLSGTYFTFYSANNTNKFYIWFNIAGNEVDPNLDGFEGIEINGDLLPEDNNASYIASIITEIINDSYGSYFTATIDDFNPTRIILETTEVTTTTTIPTDGASATGFTFIETSDDILFLDFVTETDESNITTEYYIINTYLINTLFSNIKIYGKSVLANATFNPVNMAWTFSNIMSLYNDSGNLITLQGENSGTEEERFVVQDTNLDEYIFTLQHSKGSFSLTNTNNAFLVNYNQRNNFTFEENWTLERATGDVIYQYSSISAPNTNKLQEIKLLEPNSQSLTVGDSTTGDLLDGTIFRTYVLDEENVLKKYYAWFDSTGTSTITHIDLDLPVNNVEDGVLVPSAFEGKYFLMKAGNTQTYGVGKVYYVWFTFNGSPSTDIDKPHISYEGIKVELLTGDTDPSAVADKIIAAIELADPDHYHFTCHNCSDSEEQDDVDYNIKVVNTHHGNVTFDIGTLGGKIGITTTVPGTDGTEDPNPGSEDATLYHVAAFTDGIRIDLEAEDVANDIAAKIALEFNAFGYTYSSLEENVVQITNLYDGVVPLFTNYANSNPGFVFSLIVLGANNSIEDISLILPGDVISIVGEGPDIIANYNNGFFVVQDVDSEFGIINIYNINGDDNNNGSDGTNNITGTINHYKVSEGVYGECTVYCYDLFHDSSIGIFEYNTGEIRWKDSIKGYIDYDDKKTYLRNIRTVFDNYTSTKMDKVKITPVDNIQPDGTNLGPLYEYDENSSIFTIVDISTPILKK